MNKTYYLKHRNEILQKRRKYYRENKESILKRQKQYYDKNRQTILEKQRQYYNKNRAKIINRKKEYTRNHYEQALARNRKSYHKHRAKRLEAQKRYYAQNPEKLEKRRQYLRKYHQTHKEEDLERTRRYRQKYRKQKERRYKRIKQDWLSQLEKIKDEQMTSSEKLVYVAGFIDGEGYIGLNRIRKKSGQTTFHPIVSVANTNLENVQFCKWVLGFGVMTSDRNRRNVNAKRVYILRINRLKEVLETLFKVLKFLKVKRKQAELLARYCILRICCYHPKKAYSDEEVEIYSQLRELNKRGR